MSIKRISRAHRDPITATILATVGGAAISGIGSGIASSKARKNAVEDQTRWVTGEVEQKPEFSDKLAEMDQNTLANQIKNRYKGNLGGVSLRPGGKTFKFN